MLKSMIRINVKSNRWQLAYSQPERIKLTTTKQTTPGWYRIELVAKNKAALNFISKRQIVSMTQNSNHHGAELVIEKDNRLGLVFFRHSPLRHVSVHFDSKCHQQVEFSLKLRRVSSLQAWRTMLSVVSQRDRANGVRGDHIYRLTRARYKRAGRTAALTKLIATYQPLLSYQLVSSDPYEFWCQQKEPQLIENYLHEQNTTVAPALPFTVVVKSPPNLVYNGKQNTDKSLAALRSMGIDAVKWSTFSKSAPDPTRWYLFIHEGDQIAAAAPHALGETLRRHPQACIIYSDHDKLSEGRYRFAPKLKPTWNPDFLFNQNYFARAIWFKGDLISDLFAVNKLHELDYCLNLNAITLILQSINQPQKAFSGNESIVHVPLVLLHQHDQTQNGFGELEKVAIEASMHQYAAALGDQIHNISWRSNKLLKVDFLLPENPPLVSLIIPTRDAVEITRTCVNSILERTSYPNYEIIIVDNQSRRPETLAWFRIIARNPRVRVLHYDEPFNYSAINNFAVSRAEGEIIGLINNDTEVINRNWLTEMVSHALRPQVGCVGAKLYFYDNTVQHAGVVLGIWGLAGHSHKHYHRSEPGHHQRLRTVHNMTAVTAACLVVRKEIYERVGGLETDLKVAFNDVDFCLKVHDAGYRNLFTPDAELYHYESKSRGKEDTAAKKAREQREIRYMQQRWPQIIANDPCYHPHLSRLREDFSIDIDEIEIIPPR